MKVRDFAGRKATYVLMVPFAVGFVSLLITFFKPFVFFIDTDNGDVYTRGPGLYLLYFCTAVYILFSIGFIWKYRKVYQTEMVIGLYFMYPVVIVTSVVEFFYPSSTVEMFGLAVCILFIYFNIQRPNENVHTITGFGNDGAFQTACRQALLTRRQTTVLCLNLFNYGKVRDTIGLDLNYELLSENARAMMRMTKEHHLSADYFYLGSGRFRVILHTSHVEQVNQLGQAYLEYYAQDFDAGGHKVRYLLRAMIVRFPGDVQTIDELMVLSEQLEKTSEGEGIILTGEMIQTRDFQIAVVLDSLIADALENNRFEVYYQPIWSLEEKKFVGCEALLRLNTKEFGFINPETVVRAAEQSGAIYSIGEFVLRQTCRFILENHFERFGLRFVDVNLSSLQVSGPDMAQRITRIVDEIGLPHGMLVLEITESAFSSDNQMMLENVERLRKEGFGVSLDDFGSGYSNLSRMVRLPLTTVKLDKSLTGGREGISKALDEDVLKHIQGLIRAIHCKTVVEGVETVEQSDLFESLGCEYIQGFFYSRPLCSESFLSLMQTQV